MRRRRGPRASWWIWRRRSGGSTSSARRATARWRARARQPAVMSRSRASLAGPSSMPAAAISRWASSRARFAVASTRSSRVGKWAYSVGRETPAALAIAARLGLGSVSSCARVASRMAATFRSTSWRRSSSARLGVPGVAARALTPPPPGPRRQWACRRCRAGAQAPPPGLPRPRPRPRAGTPGAGRRPGR